MKGWRDGLEDEREGRKKGFRHETEAGSDREIKGWKEGGGRGVTGFTVISVYELQSGERRTLLITEPCWHGSSLQSLKRPTLPLYRPSRLLCTATAMAKDHSQSEREREHLRKMLR